MTLPLAQRMAPSARTRRLLFASLAILCLALLPSVLAQESDGDNSGYEENPFSFGLDFTGANGIEYTVAVVCIVWGLVCLFLGVRLFKVSLFLIAWICVGGLVYYLAMLASKGDSRASFIAGMFFGVAAGLTVVKLFVVGLMVAGAFAAFILWTTYLALFPETIPPGGLYTCLAIAVVAGAVLAWWKQKWILLVATPIIGTFLFVQGLSKVVHDDRLQLNVYPMLHNDAYCNNGHCLGLFAGLACIAALGFGVQYRWTSGLRKGKK